MLKIVVLIKGLVNHGRVQFVKVSLKLIQESVTHFQSRTMSVRRALGDVSVAMHKVNCLTWCLYLQLLELTVSCYDVHQVH